MQNYPEYTLCKAIAMYLKLQYPKVIFHFDYAGLNLSKTQAGKMKAIQGMRGFPDLFIYEARGLFSGLALEIKPEGTRLYNRAGEPATDHIREQRDCLLHLNLKGYKTGFVVGFDNFRQVVDMYMKESVNK